MRRLLALSAVPALGLLVLVPAPARAQGNGPCTHQGRQVQCPPGLPPGSGSISFVPGGTNWRNSATGAIVFVPSTTFPPFVAMPPPTTPPGPTTQPGPGQPSGDPVPSGGPVLVPLNTRGLLSLTQPDREAGEPLPDPATFRERLAAVERKQAVAELPRARAATIAASKAYEGVLADLGIPDGFYPEAIATKDRMIDVRGQIPAVRIVVVRVTPELRAATARFYEIQKKGDFPRPLPAEPFSEEFKQAGRDMEAAAAAAPVDHAATERVERARDAYDRAQDAERKAQEAFDDATGEPPPLDRQLREGKLAPVEQSDADKAPTFEPFKDQGAVDEVM